MLRKLFVSLLLISLLTGNFLLPARAENSPALVAVLARTKDAIQHFHSTGLPAYALLDDYILAGADTTGQQALSKAGLSFHILDTNLTGRYYLAKRMPSAPQLDWARYGRLLLDLGDQALLQTNQAQAERISLAGAELRFISLSPIVLPLSQPSEIVVPEAVSIDPLVQYIVDQIDQETVSEYDRQLAGELPVLVDDTTYTITSRYTYSGTPIQKATSYVGQRMADQGLEVEYHAWGGSSYPNVIGEITGQTNPENIFIIGAHLDDVEGTPGADDNASGSVATMLAAEMLSEYEFDCTLRFAFWTGEEQGMLGSQAYAQRAADDGENILGYLNLDMIAWNTLDSAPDIDLIFNASIRPSRNLAQLMSDVIDAYDFDLIPQLINDKSGGSDHASFWDQGYTSILAIEDQDDFNPYYHTSNDTPANTNLPFFTEYVKASLATFLHMSGCIIPSGMGTLQGNVTDATSDDPIPNATISVQDIAGHIFSTQTDDYGDYTQRLMSGTYTVTASANGYLPTGVSGVIITTNQVTTQDFSLEPGRTYRLSGTVTEAGSGWPLYAHISFEGTVLNTWTDPDSGYYEILLPSGEYTMYVTADLHSSATRDISLYADQTQNFELELMRCTLLVDDDQDDPDTRSYYTNALDAIGADYDIWDVATAGSPNLNNVTGYVKVLWYLGGPFGDTFTSENETVIASYLDNGGNFFLSGQDYLYEMGLTSFGENYLHIGDYSEDEILNSVTGENVYSGLPTYTLAYSPFENYSDLVHPDEQSLLAFKDEMIGDAAISYEGENFNTVFLGFSLEAIDKLESREAILSRTLSFFGECTRPLILTDPQILDVQVETGKTTSTSLTLRNVTDSALNFNIATPLPPVSWLSYDPPAGPLPAYETQLVTVDFDASSLLPDVYTTTLEISVNDQPNVEITIPVILTVQPPCEAISSADFIWSPPRPDSGEWVTFSASALGSQPQLFLWNFGDGTSGQGNPIGHIYSNGGIYMVSVTVSNACSSSYVNHILPVNPIRIALPLLIK